MDFPVRSAFLALPLEGNAKQNFQELQGRLSAYADILNFQNPETPHLTLQFWHELLEIEYAHVLPLAEGIAKRTNPFTLRTIEAETFGKAGSERVLYLPVAFSDELARVKKQCPWPNVQPFMPHITIACIRHPQRFVVEKNPL